MVAPAPPLPAGPFQCPRCYTQTSALPTPQICGKCRGVFLLRAGTRVDPSVTPPPIDPRAPSIKMRSAGLLVMESSVVARDGVLQGTLDPVTGFIPLDQAGVPYGDIISIAVWRTIDWLRLVMNVLFLLPIAVGLLVLSIRLPPLFIVSLPIGALTALSFYGLLGVRRNHARVSGSLRVVTLHFHSPMWRRQRFYSELMRRAGITPAPIP